MTRLQKEWDAGAAGQPKKAADKADLEWYRKLYDTEKNKSEPKKDKKKKKKDEEETPPRMTYLRMLL